MKLWAELDSPTIEQTVKTSGVAILPIGSTEQHGPHLPTGTDHIIGWEVARRAAEKLDALLTDKFLGRDTKTGVCGDATLATREKGEKIMDLMVDATVETIRRATA
jgi:creatinine amidohydrolase/Fe(II)-dependent formamide hydrolase-like protein